MTEAISSFLFLVCWVFWIILSPFVGLAMVFQGFGRFMNDKWNPWAEIK